MFFSRARLFFCYCLLLLLVLPAVSETCAVVHVRPPTPADVARRDHNYKEAETLYTAELEKDPKSEVSLSGLIISQLGQEHIDAALATAQDARKHLPNSALIQANLGEVQFRRGELEAARTAYIEALHTNPCTPRAFYALAPLFRALSMSASARDKLDIAHRLSPDDPEITSRWMSSQPAALRAASLKNRLENADVPEAERAHIAVDLKNIDFMTKVGGDHGRCKVISTVSSMKMPFSEIMEDAQHIRAFALDVRINNRATARLQIDTGANGILIRRGIGSKAGLVPITKSNILVPVDMGDSKTRWFILDTGSFQTTLSSEAARALTKVSRDYDLTVVGLNGKVKDVLKAKSAQVTFGGLRQRLRDAVVFDTGPMSRQEGFEVSGLLGFSTLAYLKMEIDYRDGLVHFSYDPKHDFNSYY